MREIELFRSSLRELVRPKRIFTAVALIALPLINAVVWRTYAPGEKAQPEAIYNTLAASVVFGFILVIMSVVFGTGVITQELEQRTIVYLLTRPVPRWRILMIKFLAALIAITATVWVATMALSMVTHGAGALSNATVRRDLLMLPLGAAAYGALFVLLASLFSRPLLYGLIFAFGWESWVPAMPGNFARFSVMSYLRVLAPHKLIENENLEISELLAAMNPKTISESTALWVLVGVIAIGLAAAALVFSQREYVPRDEME